MSALNLFILGLPGSGKSRVARYIVEILEQNHWPSIRYNDFTILKQMSEYDTDGQFKEPDPDGIFDVKDWSAFDIALKRLEEVIFEEALNRQVVLANTNKVTIIEFSRNNYEHAFSLLKRDFIKDAYYLHLDTSVGVCKERIRNRVANHVYEDDYPVSDYIFKGYYRSDDGRNLPKTLQKFGIDRSHVLSVPNDNSFEAIIPQINRLVALFLSEIALAASTSSLRIR